MEAKEKKEYCSRTYFSKTDRRYKFGDRLKAEMTKKGLRQKDLADLVGVKIDSVREWCQHQSFPQEKHFIKICEIFAPCKPEYFYGVVDAPSYDVKFIMDYTGLSADAIEYLHSLTMPRPNKDTGDLEYIGYGIPECTKRSF